MQAQKVRTLVRVPGHTPDWHWLQSPRARIALNVARAAGWFLFAAAVTMIVGRIIGELFGVKNPADPRYPGGATPQDFEAFIALSAVLIGLIFSGWRLIPGSMIIFGGALAFWAAIPDLAPMAVLLGAFGAANLLGRYVDWRNEHHYHHEEQPTSPPKHGHGGSTTHHPVGLF